MAPHPAPERRPQIAKGVRQDYVGPKILDLGRQQLFHPSRLVADDPWQNSAAHDETRGADGGKEEAVLAGPGSLQPAIVDRNLDGRVPQFREIPRIKVGNTEEARVADLQLTRVGLVLEARDALRRARQGTPDNRC